MFKFEMTNKIKIISFQILLTCACATLLNAQKAERETFQFEIHFQENFKNDTLSVYVNNYKLENDLILNSDNVIGSAKSLIRAQRKNKLHMEIEWKSNSREYLYQKDLNIRLVSTQKEYDFLIDTRKGKYIGFYKLPNGDLKMNQSKKEFSYM